METRKKIVRDNQDIVDKHAIILANKFGYAEEKLLPRKDEIFETETSYDKYHLDTYKEEQEKELKKMRSFTSNGIHYLVDEISKQGIDLKEFSKIADESFKRLDIMELLKGPKNDLVAGEYLPGKNAIIIYEYSSILHELIHFLSTLNIDNQIVLSGFRINNYKRNDIDINDIGVGINEGYTELLNVRFSPINVSTYLYKIFPSSSTHSYPKETGIMKKLDKVLGKNTMLNLYLKHDLLGLIDELYNKGMSYNKIKYLIMGLDFYLFANDSKYKIQYKEQEKEVLNNIKKIISNKPVNCSMKDNIDIRELVKEMKK